MNLYPAHAPRLLAPALVIGVLAALSPAGAWAGPASEVVETLHERLLQVMRAADVQDHEARAAQLRPLLVESYDLPFVAATVLGGEWESLSAARRQRFVDVFTDLTVATYAARFDGHDGERFETVWERSLRDERSHVRTRLLQAGGEQVQLDYVLHDDDGRQRIINVIADGVSDLALKRAEYAAVIEGDGFDGLVDRIVRQTAEFEKEDR